MALKLQWRSWLSLLLCGLYMTIGNSLTEKLHADMLLPALAEDEEFIVEVNTGHSSTVTEEASSVADGAFKIEIIRPEQSPPEYAGKRVLIYHTHTYEAYEQGTDSQYQQTEKWRTTDTAYNVVAVGKALTASLTAMGIEVEHDTTAFEPPTLDDAYSRSLMMLEQRQAKGETYDLYIDLHRDAISSSSTIKRTVNIGGQDVARFMVLVGKGTTGGYNDLPDWEANYAIAQSITDQLNEQCDNLARNVKVKTGRFNQHVADCCVLIECGMNGNTLEEVLAGIPYLARAIADTLAMGTQ